MSARAECGCGWTRIYATVAAAEFNARRHVCPKNDHVRRATRHHRCPRCGLEQTYENAGATEARVWFNRHSCQKREDAMVRAAQAAAREALIDRTPKPCLHKRANHQHGTNAAYHLDGCRCAPCCQACSEQEDWRRRQRAYGRYNKYVSAEPVRAHLAELRDYGIGLKTVGRLAGVSNGSLTKIVYGLYADTGRGHERHLDGGRLIRPPAKRVLRKTAEAIYAVEAVPENLPTRSLDHDRTPLARTHLRSLVALGWSQSKLARRLGMQPSNFNKTVTGDRPMTRGTVDKAEALFAQLAMTLPPEDDRRDRIAATRSRRYAQERGWPPPLALDDEPTPAVDEEPDVDWVAIDRLTKAEKSELLHRWAATGRSMSECERVTGINPYRYQTKETPAA